MSSTNEQTNKPNSRSFLVLIHRILHTRRKLLKRKKKTIRHLTLLWPSPCLNSSNSKIWSVYVLVLRIIPYKSNYLFSRYRTRNGMRSNVSSGGTKIPTEENFLLCKGNKALQDGALLSENNQLRWGNCDSAGRKIPADSRERGRRPGSARIRLRTWKIYHADSQLYTHTILCQKRRAEKLPPTHTQAVIPVRNSLLEGEPMPLVPHREKKRTLSLSLYLCCRGFYGRVSNATVVISTWCLM